mmetsp:Transcript_10942/g.26574  ORF Transcript_10942/g.26574 Transcript_10942/m.26574 type:complete len:239 (-) Transcript_10942:80-796(-)
MVCPQLRIPRSPPSLGSSVTTSALIATERRTISLRVARSRRWISSTFCSHTSKRLASQMAPVLMISAMPARNSRSARRGSRFEKPSRNAMSMNTTVGWWKAPMRFLPIGVFTAVLPPTDASTMARRVVGICTKGIPRMYVDATYPVRSPHTPPPSAMQHESRLNLFFSMKSSTSSLTLRSFVVSPEGTTLTKRVLPVARNFSSKVAPYRLYTFSSATRQYMNAGARFTSSSQRLPSRV